MSTTFDVLATQASTMDRAYTDLWNYSVYAAGVIASEGGEQVKNQLNTIGQYQKSIKTLGTTLRDKVLDNTYAYSSWVGYAKELRDSIAYTLNDVSNWSWAGVLDATINQTVDDIGEGASTALKWGSAGLGLGLVVIAVMALLIYGPRR